MKVLVLEAPFDPLPQPVTKQAADNARARMTAWSRRATFNLLRRPKAKPKTPARNAAGKPLPCPQGAGSSRIEANVFRVVTETVTGIGVTPVRVEEPGVTVQVA